MKRYRVSTPIPALAIVAFAAALAQASTAVVPAIESTAPVHKHQWAAAIEKPGLPNLHKVSDALYRGAQPTAAGMKALAAMDVKTVIDLRVTNTDKGLIDATGMKLVHISVKPWHAEDEDVVAFLAVAADKANQPVFVHCEKGADRTGLMVAMSRIAVEGWSKEEAIAEMTQGGFNFHKAWRNIITYIRAVDISDIKRRAGIGK